MGIVWSIILRSARVTLGVIAGVSLVVITGLLAFDGVARAFFSAPLHGTREIAAMLMATTLLCSQPMIAAFGPHIRMDVFYNRMPKRLQRWVAYFGILVVFAFYVVVAVASVGWAMRALQIREFTGGIVAVPVYPVKVLFFTTMVYLVIYYAVLLLQGFMVKQDEND